MRFGKSYEDDDFSKGNDFVEKMQSLVRQDGWKRKKPLLIAAGVLVFLFVSYTAGFISLFVSEGAKGFTQPWWMYFVSAVTTLTGWLVMLVLAALLALLGFMVLKRMKSLDTIKHVDDRGVQYAKDGVYGTAELMTKEKAKQVFEVGNIDNAQGVVLGQFSSDGKESVSFPYDYPGNKNILVIGASGSGKSESYAGNSILQSVIRGESIVAADVKGELFEKMSELLRQEGYKVYLYNILDPKRSDAWNCVSEIYNPVDGNIDDYRLTSFANTVMKNTTEGGKDDPFWSLGEENLFKAIVAFVAWRRESELKALYEQEGKSLLSKVGHMMTKDERERTMFAFSDDEDITMRTREIALRILIGLAHGPEAADEHIAKIKRMAPRCDMAEVYYLCAANDLKQLEEKFKVVPMGHVAAIAWGIFSKGGDNVRPNFLTGLAIKLQLFQTKDIRRITSNDDIVMENISAEKTAVFLRISDDDRSMRVLTSLFFTFLFRDLKSVADREGAENRLAVNVLCDEFYNLGVLPNFDNVLSVVRSRKINISICVQNLTQLTEAYGENIKEMFISNCSVIVFFGGKDDTTTEFLSGLSGVATIIVNSTSESRMAMGNRPMMAGQKLSSGVGKRNIFTPDEIANIPFNDILVFFDRNPVLKAKRCSYKSHPLYKRGFPPQVRAAEYPLARDKYSDTEHTDAFSMGDVTNMAARNKELVHQKSLGSDFFASLEKGINEHMSRKEPPAKLTPVDSDAGAFDF